MRDHNKMLTRPCPLGIPSHTPTTLSRPSTLPHTTLLCSTFPDSSPILQYGPCRACAANEGWTSVSGFEGDNSTIATGGDSTVSNGTDPGFITTAQNATVGLNFTGESEHAHLLATWLHCLACTRVLRFAGADFVSFAFASDSPCACDKPTSPCSLLGRVPRAHSSFSSTPFRLPTHQTPNTILSRPRRYRRRL